jgi:integrase
MTTMPSHESSCKLNKRVVDAAQPRENRFILWDSELKGFGVKVELSGTKTYLVRYRPKGLGAAAPKRFVTVGRHGPLTVEQARSQAQAILGRVAIGDDPASEIAHSKGAKTFQELVESFLRDHVNAKRKPRTVKFYAALLTRHAIPSLGSRKAHSITRGDLAKLHVALGHTPHNANRLIAVIGSLYSYAAKHGLVPEGCNPAKGVEKYREEGRERFLTAEELMRLGQALNEGVSVGLPWRIDLSKPQSKHLPKHWKGQRDKLDPFAVAAIRLLILTGARLREILDLRWEWIDLERGLIFLPTSKTGRKTIVLNAAALDIIRGLAAGRGSNPFVIVGHKENASRADLNKPWNAIRRHAKLEGVRLHDLRHTFASFGAGASLGLPVIGKLLGHSQPQTTARYAHLDADPLRRASDLIGEQLSAALGGRRR